MGSDLRHLWRRGNQWWYRLAIPRELRNLPAFAGKTLIQEPLKTGDLAEAKRERIRRDAAYEAAFARARAGAALTVEEAAAIKDAALAALRDGPSIRPDYAAAAEALAVTKAELELAEIRAERDAYRYTLDRLKASVAGIAAVRGTTLEEGTPEWAAVANAILESEIEAHGVEPTPLPASGTGEKFSQAFAEYLGRIKRHKSGPDAVAGHETRARLFASFLGDDLPLASITREQARTFLDRTKQLSPDWSRNAKGLSFAKIEARHGGKAGLSDRTLNRYAETLFGVFRFARDRGTFSGPNPFLDLKRTITEQEAAEAKRELFTDAEMVQLFATRPPEIRPAKHTTRTATTWIALIAAYSGARLEELAQLSAGDVRKVDGVLCFDLHRGNGNKIKTGAGVRFVPVHSKLVAAGFLKYRDTLPSGSRLFPGLSNKNNKDEKFGGAVSDAFRRWLAEAGLKRPGLVLHSMRHTVRTKIRNSGFAESFIDWITGHEQGTIGGNYGEAPEPKVLAKAIEKINYAGLKLTAK